MYLGNAIRSCKLWKESGKPRCGLIFNNYKQDKLLYKKRLKERQACEMSSFTNDLHDALLRKSGHDFLENMEIQIRLQY